MAPTPVRQEPWASTTQTNGSEGIADTDPPIASNSLLGISRTTGEWGLPVTLTSGTAKLRYARPSRAANRFEILGPPSVASIVTPEEPCRPAIPRLVE